jgi:hypothetical protein
MNTETNVDVIVDTNPDEKKAWVTPSATVEQVSDVTRNLGGPGGDAFTCHT